MTPADPGSINHTDAYAPAEIARKVETVGIAKARLPVLQTLALGVLAGAFIAVGGAFFTLTITESGLGFGPARVLGGVAFSLGLILVVIAGAELFTGNNLIVMAWAGGKVTTAEVLRNWVLVYVANLIGALGFALMMHWSGVLQSSGGVMAQTAVSIAAAKLDLSFTEAFVRGVLCNALVCLAIWLCFAAHTVIGKIFAIIFPISAFVALGFEHSIANMYLIPIGILSGLEGVGLGDVVANLVPVTLGNIVGGSVLVALVYWVIYLRK